MIHRVAPSRLSLAPSRRPGRQETSGGGFRTERSWSAGWTFAANEAGGSPSGFVASWPLDCTPWTDSAGRDTDGPSRGPTPVNRAPSAALRAPGPASPRTLRPASTVPRGGTARREESLRIGRAPGHPHGCFGARPEAGPCSSPGRSRRTRSGRSPSARGQGVRLRSRPPESRPWGFGRPRGSLWPWSPQGGPGGRRPAIWTERSPLVRAGRHGAMRPRICLGPRSRRGAPAGRSSAPTEDDAHWRPACRLETELPRTP